MSSAQFASTILSASGEGFAGMAAGLLFEREPDLVERYGTGGFGHWREQFGHWMSELGAALAAGHPAMFADRMAWARDSFEARQAPVTDLEAGVQAMADVLAEHLPAAARPVVVAALDQARAAIRDGGEDNDADAIDPRGLRFLETVLEGRVRDAVDALRQDADGGTSIRELYLHVLIPVLRMAGRMWHAAELSIAEEHAVTAATERAMAMLRERIQPDEELERTVLLAGVAGNTHGIGVRTTADFFEMAGWRAVTLGVDTPADEIANGAEQFGADLVVLAVTLATQIEAARQTIEEVRERRPTAKILVGGPAFVSAQGLWSQIGADAEARSIEEAEPAGRRLTDPA